MKKKKRRGQQGSSMAASGTVRRAGILKYMMTFALLFYIVLLLIYSSGSTKAFEEVVGDVEAGFHTDSLVKQNAQALKRYYGLNSADYEGVALYLSEEGISAEEILLVKAGNDHQVNTIKDAVRERIDNRKDIFADVAPEQVKLLDKAQVLVRGRFVFFVVSKDAQEYADLFTESL